MANSQRKSSILKGLFVIYGVALIIWSWFSYSLTHPNLVLSTWAPYWNWQNLMWRTYFDNSYLLGQVFLKLIIALFVIYGLICWKAYKSKLNLKRFWPWLLLLGLPLIFAYNALSQDVFNYVFNAKIVTFYGANPHVTVAETFSNDLWLRFMHNTHTRAPYGYGWTAISLLPSYLGMGKLSLTWFNFTLFSGLSWVLLVWFFLKRQIIENWKVLLVLLNPLVLIEIIGNSHNDLWMMLPAMMAMSLIALKKLNWRNLAISSSLLAISMLVKLASVVLVPLFLLILAVRWLKFNKIWLILADYWPFFASLLFFIPLFTERSKYFLPWYLIWSLVWLPLFKFSQNKNWPHYALQITQRWWSWVLVALSFTSMLRYYPWLSAGHHTNDIYLTQIKITFSGLMIATILFGLHQVYRYTRSGSK